MSTVELYWSDEDNRWEVRLGSKILFHARNTTDIEDWLDENSNQYQINLNPPKLIGV